MFFENLRLFLIKKLGGFPTQKIVCKERHQWEEILQEIKVKNNEKAKHTILTEAVKHLFNTIGADDILRVDANNEWNFQGRVLMPEEVRMLKEESKLFQESRLWKVLQNDIKFQLNRKMYLESNITMDVMWGKLLVFYNDIINTRIQKMK